jgi:hypothetical protein
LPARFHQHVIELPALDGKQEIAPRHDVTVRTATHHRQPGYLRLPANRHRIKSISAFLHGNDVACGEVVEISWVGGVVARKVGIGIVVEHCVQAEVIEIREKKAWASVKEMVGRKVVEVDAALSIIGIEPILVTHVKVIDEP